MNSLFICDTPYQVFNSIVLRLNQRDEGNTSDIYIVNQFSRAEDIYKALQDKKIFDGVFSLKKERALRVNKNWLFNIYKRLSFISPKIVVADQLPHEYKIKKIYSYDVIYASIMRNLTTAILQMNQTASFRLFEDGIGNYIRDLFYNKDEKNIYKLICRLTKREMLYKRLDCIYLHNADMCSVPLSYEKRDMPPIDEKTRSVLNDVFPVENADKYADKTFVLLSTPNDTNDNRINMLLNETSGLLEKYRSHTIVRLHPREKDYGRYKNFEVDPASDMWENLILNTDFKAKCLISINSTAQFTPKLLANQEPWLIFLYDIEQDGNGKIIEMVDNMKRIYSDPDRIMVPKSFSELESCIQTVFDAIGHEKN